MLDGDSNMILYVNGRSTERMEYLYEKDREREREIDVSRRNMCVFERLRACVRACVCACVCVCVCVCVCNGCSYVMGVCM